MIRLNPGAEAPLVEIFSEIKRSATDEMIDDAAYRLVSNTYKTEEDFYEVLVYGIFVDLFGYSEDLAYACANYVYIAIRDFLLHDYDGEI